MVCTNIITCTRHCLTYQNKKCSILSLTDSSSVHWNLDFYYKLQTVYGSFNASTVHVQAVHVYWIF